MARQHLKNHYINNQKYDIIIIGAGASGLFCAHKIASHNINTLIIEKSKESGQKLCLSGGGKANFSNREITKRHYHSLTPNACIPALKAFTPKHALQIINRWNLPYEERNHGQLFLCTSAKKLRDALLGDCYNNGVHIIYNSPVNKIWIEDGLFHVFANNSVLISQGLCIATGSPAHPQCGASDIGFSLARSLGHSIIPLHPALSPLIMPTNWPSPELSCKDLSGICLPVKISIIIKNTQYTFEDDLLFTHNGISGPATLKTSLFWEHGKEICINFAPSAQFENILDIPSKMLVRNAAYRLAPQRLVDALLPKELANRKCAELSRAQRHNLATAIHKHTCTPRRTVGLKKAEVCRGGISMAEINPKSMESSKIPHLWFLGEILDMTGLLGGYNLHWAWASALLAAQSIIKKFATKK